MADLPRNISIALLLTLLCHATSADDAAPPTKSARQPMKLPGIVIDFDKQCIDLEGVICLEEGLLELVACTKGSKEHESIVAVTARPLHIHTALLVLGAKNGHPVIRKQLNNGEGRWVNLPPRGDCIGVFLVTKLNDGKEVERPISDFVAHAQQQVDEVDGAVLNAPDQTKAERGQRFAHTFLFAGSHLRDVGAGPREYLADVSGNVISIATFGDEVLCVPYHQTQNNALLMWQVKPESLPKTGSKITLRLRRTSNKVGK